MFASEAVKGWEALAAALLAAPEGWAASDIVAKLPAVDRSQKAQASAAGAAVWERAQAKLEAGRAPVTASSQPASQDTPASTTNAASVWERAYAKKGRA